MFKKIFLILISFSFLYSAYSQKIIIKNPADYTPTYKMTIDTSYLKNLFLKNSSLLELDRYEFKVLFTEVKDEYIGLKKDYKTPTFYPIRFNVNKDEINIIDNNYYIKKGDLSLYNKVKPVTKSIKPTIMDYQAPQAYFCTEYPTNYYDFEPPDSDDHKFYYYPRHWAWFIKCAAEDVEEYGYTTIFHEQVTQDMFICYFNDWHTKLYCIAGHGSDPQGSIDLADFPVSNYNIEGYGYPDKIVFLSACRQFSYAWYNSLVNLGNAQTCAGPTYDIDMDLIGGDTKMWWDKILQGYTMQAAIDCINALNHGIYDIYGNKGVLNIPPQNKMKSDNNTIFINQQIENELAFKVNKLSGNYPNPFNPSTNIRYSIAKPGFVSLKVFDMQGREVRVLEADFKNAGDYEVRFNAMDLPSGNYYYRLKTDGFTDTKRMQVLR